MVNRAFSREYSPRTRALVPKARGCVTTTVADDPFQVAGFAAGDGDLGSDVGILRPGLNVDGGVLHNGHTGEEMVTLVVVGTGTGGNSHIIAFFVLFDHSFIQANFYLTGGEGVGLNLGINWIQQLLPPKPICRKAMPR